MTRFLGVDLAWSEGTAAKAANESGLACIDDTGRVIAAGWARGIDAVVDWIQRLGEPGTVLAVDAPLVVNNPTGMRVCEKETGSRYGRWHVSANASNQALPRLGGVTLRRRLEQLGWCYTDGLAPLAPTAASFFECYPYTTLVGAAEFGYDDKRPRYKRMGTALPLTERRAARATVCDDLIQRMWRLADADPPLHLGTHESTDSLVIEPTPLTDAAYKHREDLIDALLSAWTASLWHRHGTARSQVLGAADPLVVDGRRGTIIAPARVEQRRGADALRAAELSARAASAPSPVR
jgi:predicted RNase H-like nuclease